MEISAQDIDRILDEGGFAATLADKVTESLYPPDSWEDRIFMLGVTMRRKDELITELEEAVWSLS